MVVYEGIKLFIISGAVLTVGASQEKSKILVRIPRQFNGRYGLGDQNLAATGSNAEELKGGGNYFQDIYVLRPSQDEIEYGLVFETPHVWQQRYERKDFSHNRHQGKHVPEHDKYESGHKRGNDYHFIEKYEKGIPPEGQFKAKLRWADEKGGRGEHYWDFNHAGPEDDKEKSEDDGENSDTVPVYANHQPAPKNYYTRQSENVTGETGVKSAEVASQISSTTTDRSFTESIEEEIEGIGRHIVEGKEDKRAKDSAINISDLFFQATNGQLVDKKTGKKYVLSPIN